MLKIYFNAYKTVIVSIILLALVSPVSHLVAEVNYLKKAEEYISSMRKSLDNVAVEIRKATEKSDLTLVNCLRQKEALMKNYFNASLRNQENLRSAWKVKDKKESDRFLKLIEIAHKNVKDIEDRLKECRKGDVGDDRTKVMVIKPEGAPSEAEIEGMFEDGEIEEEEEFPAVPPASPFR